MVAIVMMPLMTLSTAAGDEQPEGDVDRPRRIGRRGGRDGCSGRVPRGGREGGRRRRRSREALSGCGRGGRCGGCGRRGGRLAGPSGFGGARRALVVRNTHAATILLRGTALPRAIVLGHWPAAPGIPARGRCRDSGTVAGPSSTVPSGAKREPCSGQSHDSSASFQRTTPPRWVHTAVSAQVVPSTVETATGVRPRRPTVPVPSAMGSSPSSGPVSAAAHLVRICLADGGVHGDAGCEVSRPRDAMVQDARPLQRLAGQIGGQGQRGGDRVRHSPLVVAGGQVDPAPPAREPADEGHTVGRTVVLGCPPVRALGTGEHPLRPGGQVGELLGRRVCAPAGVSVAAHQEQFASVGRRSPCEGTGSASRPTGTSRAGCRPARGRRSRTTGTAPPWRSRGRDRGWAFPSRGRPDRHARFRRCW